MVLDQISERHRVTSQRAVLAILREHGPLTVDQIMRLLPFRPGHDWTANRVRPACTELARRGLVYKTDEPGVSDRGFRCAIWAAYPANDESENNMVKKVSKAAPSRGGRAVTIPRALVGSVSAGAVNLYSALAVVWESLGRKVDPFPASLTTLSEIAGVQRDTVIRLRGELVDAGWVAYEGTAGGSASRYTFTSPSGDNND